MLRTVGSAHVLTRALTVTAPPSVLGQLDSESRTGSYSSARSGSALAATSSLSSLSAC